ncbi:MAG: class I SAM-dependent methyltransferase [bacterium]|nr:class I SAM-dependent methyltransferase [bacterium]
MKMMKIPDCAVPFILFQRTEYLVVQNNVFWNRFRIRIPFLTYNRYVSLEAFLFKNRTKHLFNEDIAKEYDRIKDYLPAHALRVLDIGCGVAGIDILLSRHYKDAPHVYLLDKSRIEEEVYYGLEQKGAFYNSLEVAKKLLIENGVAENHIHVQEVGAENEIGYPGPFDLVISLISWGFHYPVSTYLDQAYELLVPGGTLIIDVRKGSDGRRLLEKKFGRLEMIYDAQKHERFVARKPKEGR